MFTSTKDFDTAICSILKHIQEGNPEFFTEFENGKPEFLNTLQIDKSDAHDALERAIDLKLVHGISLKRIMDTAVFIKINNPRLSYNGLSFLEKHSG